MRLNLEQLQFDSASKHAQGASETAASVTVITRFDIRAYGYRTLASIQSGRPPAAARGAFPPDLASCALRLIAVDPGVSCEQSVGEGKNKWR